MGVSNRLSGIWTAVRVMMMFQGSSKVARHINSIYDITVDSGCLAHALISLDCKKLCA